MEKDMKTSISHRQSLCTTVNLSSSEDCTVDRMKFHNRTFVTITTIFIVLAACPIISGAAPQSAESSTPDELLERTARVIETGSPSEIKSIIEKLQNLNFIMQLNGNEEDRDWSTSNLYRLLDCIAIQNSQAAQDGLLALTKCELYKDGDIGSEERRHGVVRSLRYIKKPDKRILQFLDSVAELHKEFYPAIQSLAAMTTPEAVAIIEQRLRSPDYRIDFKQGICQEILVQYRATGTIVEMYDRLLHAQVDDQLKDALVDGLFQYHKEWANQDVWLPPQQPLEEATTDTLKILASLADESAANENIP